MLIEHNLRCREQWIRGPKELLTGEKRQPVDDDLAHVVTDGEETCREAFGEFGAHLAGILKDPALDDVYVLQLSGGDGPIARSREKSERDQGSVAQLHVGGVRHALQHMLDLLERGHRPGNCGLRDPGLLLGEREVVSIGVGQTRPVARLPGQPLEEGAQGVQRTKQSPLAKRQPRLRANLNCQLSLEAP